MGWEIHIGGRSLWIISKSHFSVGCLQRLTAKLCRRQYDYVRMHIQGPPDPMVRVLFERRHAADVVSKDDSRDISRPANSRQQ